MKTVKIPGNASLWECNINGVRYAYPGGTTQSVPDEVAALISTTDDYPPAAPDVQPPFEAGKGDMNKSDYDADGAVKEAGGIAAYVEEHGGSGDMLAADYDADGEVKGAGGIAAYVAEHGGGSDADVYFCKIKQNDDMTAFEFEDGYSFEALVEARDAGKALFLVATDNGALYTSTAPIGCAEVLENTFFSVAHRQIDDTGDSPMLMYDAYTITLDGITRSYYGVTVEFDP